MKFLNLSTALIASIVGLNASAASSTFYCAELNKSNAYIIGEGVIVSSADGAKVIQINEIGRGDSTENGDGTIGFGFDLKATQLTSDPTLAAKSPQWKSASAFLLSLKSGESRILYISPEAFQGKSDFKARIKDNSGAEDKNTILNCNRT